MADFRVRPCVFRETSERPGGTMVRIHGQILVHVQKTQIQGTNMMTSSAPRPTYWICVVPTCTCLSQRGCQRYTYRLCRMLVKFAKRVSVNQSHPTRIFYTPSEILQPTTTNDTASTNHRVTVVSFCVSRIGQFEYSTLLFRC
jgi:hypothetical protein